MSAPRFGWIQQLLHMVGAMRVGFTSSENAGRGIQPLQPDVAELDLHLRPGVNLDAQQSLHAAFLRVLVPHPSVNRISIPVLQGAVEDRDEPVFRTFHGKHGGRQHHHGGDPQGSFMA